MLKERTDYVISILMPTRARRSQAENFVNTAIFRASKPTLLEFIIYVDEDDQSSHCLDSLGDRITLLIGPRVTMGAMYTSCLTRANGDLIVLANDDAEILTAGWDTNFRQVHASYPDEIYLAYPDDLYKRKATFPIISRKCAKILKNPYPAEYEAAFIDTHLVDTFQRVRQRGFDRIVFLESVVFEHRHYRAGKSKVDSTYLNRPRFNGDRTFLSQIGRRNEQADLLISTITNEPRPRIEYSCRRCPTALASGVLFILKYLALDKNLPSRWRIFLTAFLIARAIVSTFQQKKLP